MSRLTRAGQQQEAEETWPFCYVRPHEAQHYRCGHSGNCFLDLGVRGTMGTEGSLLGLQEGERIREKATQAMKVISPVQCFVGDGGLKMEWRILSSPPLGKGTKNGDCLIGKQDTRKSELRWFAAAHLGFHRTDGSF